MITLPDFFQKNTLSKVIQVAKESAKSQGLSWKKAYQVILTCTHNAQTLAPNIKANSESELLKKWILKYEKGYEHRSSYRRSNLPGTTPDPIIDLIISSRLPNLQEHDTSKIKFAHRLSMSAENILGCLLEEYLDSVLRESDWYCCWGEVVRHVDFVHEDLSLLQIKNRSNSENSSSSRVRIGTEIQKWYRVKANNGEYMWPRLTKLTSKKEFSESNFRKFVSNTLCKNPGALALESENPWQ